MAADHSDFAHAIAVAVELAGRTDRGVGESGPEEIRDLMTTRNVPEELFSVVEVLVDAFLAFAMNIRAAAAKDSPIIPVFGERDLPR